MNLARVSSNGQITVPVEIRRKLAIKEGDKIMFFEKNGEIVLKIPHCLQSVKHRRR